MPIGDEYRDICEMLLKATDEGRVHWTEELGPTFKVKLPDLDFVTWCGREEKGGEFVAVGMRNPSHLDYIDLWELEEGDQDFELLKRLHSAAKRYAQRIPEKLESLRSHLLSGERIGQD